MASDGTPKSRVYLVCDGCGFFYGDIRLYPDAVVKCEECGSEAAWAFPTLEKALDYQAQVKSRGMRSSPTGHLCPTCERPLAEVRVTVTGVCPTHGVTPVICGNPECWCARTKEATGE